ncbi:hypothetical protein QQS21_012411 [Conoideocrella luteorostrata]|uniref:Uncharacterized protein n=1 Tax=Conoideocrella luteorostrata TaxID=1105319 RepID=A0AAJ0CE28_9HYPO|nr:hypothetical protein QQS21_012411 [Conoideocrella luteorostrata]
MRALFLLPLFPLGLDAFQPNKGSECTLTCRNRVPINSCPPGHWVGGQYKTCANSQYGCTDSSLNDCGNTQSRPPLCVVDGPCLAGPAGCLEDKTGADDHLPAGKYVGHCPSQEQEQQRKLAHLKELCDMCHGTYRGDWEYCNGKCADDLDCYVECAKKLKNKRCERNCRLRCREEHKKSLGGKCEKDEFKAYCDQRAEEYCFLHDNGRRYHHSDDSEKYSNEL